MQQEAMEDDKNNPKYAKLLAEYSKVCDFINPEKTLILAKI